MKPRILRHIFPMLLAVIMALGGCSQLSGAEPTPLPTVVLGTAAPASESAPPARTGGVSASGVAAPARQSRLVFPVAGRIAALEVAAGDAVDAGEILARLEGQEDLLAATSRAEFELVQADQALKDLQTASETARVQAMKDIITYERAVRDARYALDNFTVPIGQSGLDAVDALNRMKQRLDEASAAFEPYRYRPSSDPIREDRKEALDSAQADYNTAVKRLQYEYDLEVAEAQLARALADYEALSAGPKPDQLRLAEARLANARTQLDTARSKLNHLTLTAPFSGTITTVYIHNGEWVIPGEPVLLLTDLKDLRIETSDLSERDLPNVQIGQSASVLIKALGVTVTGRVIEIAPVADSLGGDVVYKTILTLDSIPEGLRAGMSVEVRFEQS